MRKLFLALFSAHLIVVVLMPLAAMAEKRVALVIGNDRYQNFPAQRQLQKAVNDAEAVGDTLAKLGFTVIRGQNLNRQRTIEQLSIFSRQLEPGDIAAFFFAGHGVAVGGVNYLLPSDMPSAESETIVRGNALSETEVTAEIQSKGVRVALLVLDACRDNPLPRSGTRSLGNTRGLAESKPARGVFTIYSAGIGQAALDRLETNDPNRNSVFTRVFVQQLARSDLHLGDLAVDVREKVAELALKAKDDSGQLSPHEQTPAYYDQTVGGRIYLAGRGGETPQRVAPPPAAEPAPRVALVPPVVPKNASGAVAIGQTGDVVKDGLAIGWATSSVDRARAEFVAMEKCRNFKDAPERSRSRCEIVSTFEDQCLAISLDPKAGTPGYGWAVRPTRAEAKNLAMKNCRASAKNRAKFCVDSNSSCSGTAN